MRVFKRRVCYGYNAIMRIRYSRVVGTPNQSVKMN